MSDHSLTEVLAKARAIGRAAGALLLEGKAQGFIVEHKGPVDLVTEYDRRSEALVVQELQRAFPDHCIIAEEGGMVQQEGEAQAVWYVDPLDGTTNYAHGLPFYAVSIGLELQGEPAVGVVYAPEMSWEFYAAQGQGAWLNQQRLTVSAAARLSDALLATGFPYSRMNAADNNLAEFTAVYGRCQGIRRVGAASLDCAMVAWGVMDGYWEFLLHPWDICAGALLVREAGGQVSNINGSPFRTTDGRILATNGRLHQELGEVLCHARGTNQRD